MIVCFSFIPISFRISTNKSILCLKETASPDYFKSIQIGYYKFYSKIMFIVVMSLENQCDTQWTLSSNSSSVAQSYPTLCDPMDCSTPALPVHHQLPEFTQTHVHWVSDAIQPSHPLSSPSPPAFNLSQHQGLFKWVSFSHEVAKILEFQLQHQSFQWIYRTDFL